MSNKLQGLIEILIPSGTKIREFYDKLWTILNLNLINKVAFNSSWGLKIFLLIKKFDNLLTLNPKNEIEIKRFSISHPIFIDQFYNKILKEIDQKICDANPKEIVELFEPVPLNIFGLLSLELIKEYPNISNFFPKMPSEQLQNTWVGQSGIPLLKQTLFFVSSLVKYYEKYLKKSIKTAKILDYGCGWGRILRILYKYVPTTNLFGVDPYEDIIKICKMDGVKGNLSLCDYIPKDLPFKNQNFDLIYAFSVFTHLSERSHKAVLQTLYKKLNKDGILVLTIRPRYFWNYYLNNNNKQIESVLKTHDEYGYAFHPHNREPIDGDITYGDTSITFKYIRKNWNRWQLIHRDFTLLDPHQLICVFKKK